MKSIAQNVNDYLKEIPDQRKQAFLKLRETIVNSIPKGFVEQMSYGTIGFVVQHDLYPKGYHCDPKLPLPFINIASQKKFIALYHMGIYANPELLQWFSTAFPKYSNQKLDMGKSCIRFKNFDQIPFDLIAALMQKMSLADWITSYESQIRKTK